MFVDATSNRGIASKGRSRLSAAARRSVRTRIGSIAAQSILWGDIIEPVPRGEFGGDIIHRVRNHVAQICGTMLWEAKSTKAWNNRGLEKLRADQRSTNAEIGLIVSNVLPAGVETFDRIDNVWVTKKRLAIPLAIALRQSLIQVSNSRQAATG